MGWFVWDTWIVVAGVLSAVACALPGCFLVLRKMSMMGDAITHAVLPGIAIAFIITGSRSSVSMFTGAVVSGLITAFLTQWVNKNGKLDLGSSMGIVFSVLFAVGLLLIEYGADFVDLDPSCVLYGAIEFTPLERFWWGIPRAVWVLSSVVLLNVTLLILFYKELLLNAFDQNLANSLGISSEKIHYYLMVIVAVTAVATFEVVGSVMVVALLIVPAGSAYLLTVRLSHMLYLSVFFGALGAILGHILAIKIPSMIGFNGMSTSGMIAVVLGVIFSISWTISVFVKSEKFLKWGFLKE